MDSIFIISQKDVALGSTSVQYWKNAELSEGMSSGWVIS